MSLFIFEWRDYWVCLPGVDALRIGTKIHKSSHGEWFLIRYENELGISQIQPFIEGRPVGLPVFVEVMSPKFNTPQKHQTFFSSLLDDLYKRLARLPFTFDASTSQSVVEALQPPTPLFTFHFLKHYAEDLKAALAIIFAYPHRLLTDEEMVVPLATASNIGPDTLLDMMHHSSQWTKADRHPLANRLNGCMPTHILQHLPEETFDTPENRFVLYFLSLLQVAADQLKTQSWWTYSPLEDKRKINETLFLLQQALNHPIFEEVGEQKILPFNSQVLLRKDGYRQIMELWQKFNLARRPLFAPLHKAIETRNVAELYEYWVFFSLAEQIGDLLEIHPVFQLRSSDKMGLEWSSQTLFSTCGKLIFNRTYYRNSQHFHTYSTTMRPDFTWVRNGSPKVIFDAKFSFGTIDKILEEGELSEQYETIPSLGDLYKMHTYRDALRLDAAIIIYPGNSSVFFELDRGKRTDVGLSDCLSDELHGIGAIPMQPGSNL